VRRLQRLPGGENATNPPQPASNQASEVIVERRSGLLKQTEKVVLTIQDAGGGSKPEIPPTYAAGT
jgi:hypothetical protein